MGGSKYVEEAWSLRQIEEPHHNCAQSVFMPFSEKAGVSEETAFRIAQNFGGGMKRGSVCGAVTGGLMAMGLLGIDDVETLAEYHEKIAANHGGMLDCADLLAANEAAGKEKKPHCDAIVCECAALVEELLARKKEKG